MAQYRTRSAYDLSVGDCRSLGTFESGRIVSRNLLQSGILVVVQLSLSNRNFRTESEDRGDHDGKPRTAFAL